MKQKGRLGAIFLRKIVPELQNIIKLDQVCFYLLAQFR